LGHVRGVDEEFHCTLARKCLPAAFIACRPRRALENRRSQIPCTSLARRQGASSRQSSRLHWPCCSLAARHFLRCEAKMLPSFIQVPFNSSARCFHRGTQGELAVAPESSRGSASRRGAAAGLEHRCRLNKETRHETYPPGADCGGGARRRRVNGPGHARVTRRHDAVAELLLDQGLPRRTI